MWWRVRRLAAARGWTVARLARRAGVLPQNLARWARRWPVRGGRTDTRVARALGISVAALGAGVADEIPGPLDQARAVVRGGGWTAAQIVALGGLHLGSDVLDAIARDWRVRRVVRDWARRELADAVRREVLP